MGWLATAFGWLTGGGDTANKVVDGVKNAADALVFTDQEKSEANQKALGLYIEYQKATLPQNLARRIIAIIVVSLWAFVVGVDLVGVVFHLAYVKDLGELLGKVNAPFMLVMGFYYLKRIKQQ